MSSGSHRRRRQVGVLLNKLEFLEENAMVDTIEGTTEVNRGDCCHMSGINSSRDPFDSVNQGIPRRVTFPVNVL